LTGMSLKELNDLIETKAVADCPVTSVRVKCERIGNRTTGRNVIGMLRGTSDTSIYITAHYDHLGTDGRFYFRGADDNASGVASMLELARLFSANPDRKYNLVFLAATGEEVGELGSKYQVQREDFDPRKVLVTLNIDMVGRIDSQHVGKEAYLYSLGTDTQPKLAALFEEVDQRVPDCSFDYTFNNSHDLTGYYMRSDQYRFYEKGIPAVMFFSGLHKDYHQPTDTPEKINYSLLQERIFLISQVILALQRDGATN
jgi:Zn-dependent M28 family amino/carboxypeptidase